ncbi:hypothetical protein ACIF80_10535 [Streptomyces sp. NPDC085927]|uniref:hypothetical protein n=1 Tax=Streptomyces sp. NPDC085927 TaxID=3365738 RepID=UPI0037CECCCA
MVYAPLRLAQHLRLAPGQRARGHCRPAAEFPDGGGLTVRQLYLSDTAVLVTRFMAPGGVGEVADFMAPIDSPAPTDVHRLVRVARVVRGSLPFALSCQPRFDYGRAPHVNVVQSSFPEEQQGEISGLSRSVSHLGSSFGTAIAGTILVAGLTKGAYAAAMITLACIGLAAAALLPRGRGPGTPKTPRPGAFTLPG